MNMVLIIKDSMNFKMVIIPKFESRKMVKEVYFFLVFMRSLKLFQLSVGYVSLSKRFFVMCCICINFFLIAKFFRPNFIY